MPVIVPNLGPLLAELGKLESPPLPRGAAPEPTASRQPDTVILAQPATVATLSTLASSGLAQLGALLPKLERMVQGAPDPIPSAVGYLARALGDAAHAIDTGYAGTVATPEQAQPGPKLPELKPPLQQASTPPPSKSADPPRDRPGAPTAILGRAAEAAPMLDRAAPPRSPAVAAEVQQAAPDRAPPALARPDKRQPGDAPARELLATPAHSCETPAQEAWRHAARDTLQDAAGLLTRAEQRLAPDLPPNPAPTAMISPDLQWALSQIVGAQRQVAGAQGRLSMWPRSHAQAPHGTPGATAQLHGALAAVGAAVMLVMGVVAYGASGLVVDLVGTVVALAAAFAWGWRVVVTSRSLKLELRR